MFKRLAQLRYLESQGSEHIWSAGEKALLAGTMLGSTIVRVRLIRGSSLEEARYRLADGGSGSLPYHSWTIMRGDEQWPSFEVDAQSILEPYLQTFALSETELRLIQPLTADERIYAFGERTGDINKRGQSFPIWNVDPDIHHTTSTETMYVSIPFYIGFRLAEGRAYGVLIDHNGRVDADMGKSNEGEATLTIEGDMLIAYFFTGPTTADVVQQYTELTGRMPLPPRWALGYHQCRWGYASEQQVRDVATRLRERNHPCDAIWLDIDYMNGFRNFTWDEERFPDPARLAQELHEMGFHLVTIVDPGTKIDDTYDVYQEGLREQAFCRFDNGTLFQGNVWPGPCVFPDFSQSRVRTWWGDLSQRLLRQGVDGLWNDMNEPSLTNMLNAQGSEGDRLHGKTIDLNVLHRAGGEEVTGPDGPPVRHRFFHNAYGMEMARASYEGLLHLRPDSRPFVLSRAGTAGIQRYAAVWTGDNTSEWEHILLALRMCLNLGMSGVPFVGADIGGFWDASNGELLVRFAQMGALMPFCRNHNAVNNPDQEPWAFGEPFESAYRTAIETRYRLLPYLYTLFHEASTQGAPVMRPLYYHYPQDEQACDTETAFLVGENLLSAPVALPGLTSRSVYLPEGNNWFDYWNGTEYPGGTTAEIPAPLDRWPLLVRANSIVPTGSVMQFVDQHPAEPLTFTCFMATDGQASYTLYEDDGRTQAYRTGASARTEISCRVESDLITVRIDEQYSGYKPQREVYEIVVWVGSRVLQQRVPAGQGTAVIHL